MHAIIQSDVAARCVPRCRARLEDRHVRFDASRIGESALRAGRRVVIMPGIKSSVTKNPATIAPYGRRSGRPVTVITPCLFLRRAYAGLENRVNIRVASPFRSSRAIRLTRSCLPPFPAVSSRATFSYTLSCVPRGDPRGYRVRRGESRESGVQTRGGKRDR